MLTSTLFAGDALLQKIADDVDATRISRTSNRSGPPVQKVQQALLIWDATCLPRFGADGKYGNESAAAVTRFKTDELAVPAADVIDDVGPRTVQRLDEIALASQPPTPGPTPVPGPGPTPTPTATVFTRREIFALEAADPFDPHTLAYARAVRQMQSGSLPFPSDPRSWRFQGAIHGSDGPPPAGSPPDAANSWAMCQHEGWFFLPWHRMYILWFERIVRSIVISQGGPSDWALPYWNWQGNGGVLPRAFREPNLPASAGGGANPLFVVDRDPNLNNGTVGLDPAVTNSSIAAGLISFTSAPGVPTGFGGDDTAGPSHFNAGLAGEIEQQPHNQVHNFVSGLMADGNTAALDPIFWLHHAMIDRLWSRWLVSGGGRANPAASGFLDQSFSFYDENGAQVTQQVRDVLSTTTLGYRYDDDPPPASVPLTAVVPGLADRAREVALAAVSHAGEPEELGASGPVQLGVEAASTPIDLSQGPALEAGLLASPDSGPSAVTLLVDDIAVTDPQTPPYEVYLNVPDVTDGGEHDSPHFVGFLEFFGATHSHGGEEAGGARRAFDITTLVHKLEQEGRWDPRRVEVTFVPARGLRRVDTGELVRPAAFDSGAPSVKVGTVRILAE
jgi:tyrosinase